MIWNGEQGHADQKSNGKSFSRGCTSPEDNQRQKSGYKKPDPGRLVEKTQQSKRRNAPQAGQDVNAVRGHSLGSVLKVPADELAEGDKRSSNYGEQGNDKADGQEHTRPASGHRRNTPDVNFNAGTQQLR